MNRRPSARAIRLLATAALAVGVAWSPMSSATPAAGAIDYVQFHQMFAGTNGFRWILGGTAYAPHGAASTADSALLLYLASCRTGDLFHCDRAGAWRLPLPAGALHVASDFSSANLRVTVAGTTLTVDLAAPSTDPTSSYDFQSAGATADPVHPDFAAGAGVGWPAVGTVSFAGLRCVQRPDAFDPWMIGTFAGAQWSGGSFANESFYSASAPPRGLAAGFVTGSGYRPACLTAREAPPNSGARVVGGAGPTVGSFRVEKGRQPRIADMIFTPASATDDVNGLLLVKRRGAHELTSASSFYASGLGSAIAGGYWALGSKPLDPGDYTFALWSDRGATLWFPPGTVRHVTVERHPRVTAGHKVATTEGAQSMAGAQWVTGSPVRIGDGTYAVMQATLVDHTEFVPPAGYDSTRVCFKTAGTDCSDPAGEAYEGGDDYGLNFGPDYNPLRHPDTPGFIFPFAAAIGLPLVERPAPGSYTPAVSYEGTASTDRLDLVYLSVDLP